MGLRQLLRLCKHGGWEDRLESAGGVLVVALVSSVVGGRRVIMLSYARPHWGGAVYSGDGVVKKGDLAQIVKI